MPKVDIDYSNTLFYKIYCIDPSVNDLYIGHTTNFVQRKHAHKQGCKNAKSSNYTCKLYNFIRANKGWDNWNMEIIAFHNCHDHYSARKIEQKYFEEYNATLNSIAPLPPPKQKPILQPKQETEILYCNNNTNGKYNCETCDYNTSYKRDYNKHLSTKKHISNELSQKSPDSPIQLVTPQYICNHCEKKYIDRTGLWRHKKNCTYNNESNDNANNNAQTSTSPVYEKEEMSVMKELITALMTQNETMQKQLSEIIRMNNTKSNM